MRMAVLSDVHGNMDALEKVLEDINGVRPDSVYSLGDNIGYGPEPERVIQTLRTLGIPSVLGNHEQATNQPELLSWFNPAARKSLNMTFGMLGSESLDYISALPSSRVLHGVRLVHGFPPDSSTLYLFQVPAADKESTFQQLSEPICFMGHTHVVDIIGFDPTGLVPIEARPGVNRLDPALKYFINVGSVGQPRDGDLRAKYVIWDSADSTLDIRCVPYDAHRAASKIRLAGLPEQHARRLLE
jgi:predicted phosphodiesterase